MLTSWKAGLLIRHPAGRMHRARPREIPANLIDVLRAAGSPAESAAVSDSLTQRAAVGTPGHLARGQQFLGQNYFPALVSKPVRENKNVTFCCDACERGSWRRPWSVVTRVHLVAATAEAWPWAEKDDGVDDDEDEGEDEGEYDVPDPCPYPRRPRSCVGARATCRKTRKRTGQG